jgi:hypothetical protein
VSTHSQRQSGCVALIMAGLLYAIPVAMGTALASITVPKLVVMAQIEGWLPGARREVVQITEKWHSDRGRDTGYWVAWGTGDVRVVGNHRLDLRPDEWSAARIGDPLSIVHAGGGPFDVYRRGGVFTEPGQFLLDGVLLLVEAALVCLGGSRVVRLVKAGVKASR